MLIELNDDAVATVVIAELQWAYEYCLKELDDTNELVRLDALREVLEYFMPSSEHIKYFEEIEAKYGR
jgi:lipase chaperone LimK